MQNLSIHLSLVLLLVISFIYCKPPADINITNTVVQHIIYSDETDNLVNSAETLANDEYFTISITIIIIQISIQLSNCIYWELMTNLSIQMFWKILYFQ